MNFRLVIGNIEITAEQETFSFKLGSSQNSSATLLFLKMSFILFVSHILKLFPDAA